MAMKLYSSVLILLWAFKLVESQTEKTLDTLERQLSTCDVTDVASRVFADSCWYVDSCLDKTEYLVEGGADKAVDLLEYCRAMYGLNSKKLTDPKCVEMLLHCSYHNAGRLIH